MKNRSLLFLILGIAIFFSCKNEASKNAKTQNQISEVSDKENSTEIILFDGTNTEDWRVFNGTEFPDNWSIEEGTLKCDGTAATIENGGDLVYVKAFENFELSLEWKISSGGNSGIFYHIVEGKEYHAPYQTGPEYQILDDAGFPELNHLELSGADYAMYPSAPSKKTIKPVGEWNTSKIVFTPVRTEHWLNGQKVVEFVPWSEEWKAKKAASKWNSEANYGAAKTGLIGLQDHGQPVWYRNIRIKEL